MPLLPARRRARSLSVRATVALSGSIALLAAASAAAVASAGASDPDPSPDPQAVARATITEREALAHVRFLASDELAGRDTATAGQRVAARYMASALERWGIEPAAEDGGYYQRFALESLSPVAGATLSWSGPHGRGEMPLAHGTSPIAPLASAGRIEAPIVFCGYGITAPDLGYDDYDGIDVQGKIVLLLRHTPREAEPEHAFSQPAARVHALFRTKQENAARHGAAAVLVVTDPLHHEDDGFVQRWPLLGGLYRGDAAPPGAGDGAGVAPLLQVSRAAAGSILEAAGQSLGALRLWQIAIDEDVRPHSRDLGVSVALSLGLQRDAVPTENVCGLVRGADPALRDEVVVIGAHYDHVGTAESGDGDRIRNGADDNASGSAGLLEIAQALALAPVPPRRSVILVWFSAEEKGLLGSRHYVEHPLVPLDRTIAMINLDMIGRNEPDAVGVSFHPQSPLLQDALARANASVGMSMSLSAEVGDRSDHASFHQAGVPVLFFCAGGHPDYHQPSDHADRIVASKLERVARLAFNVAWEIAASDARPERPHDPRARAY